MTERCTYVYPGTGGVGQPCFVTATGQDGRCNAHRDWQARAEVAEARAARLVEALGQATEAVEHLLEYFDPEETPGPGIREDVPRWRAALSEQQSGRAGAPGEGVEGT